MASTQNLVEKSDSGAAPKPAVEGTRADNVDILHQPFSTPKGPIDNTFKRPLSESSYPPSFPNSKILSSSETSLESLSDQFYSIENSVSPVLTQSPKKPPIYVENPKTIKNPTKKTKVDNSKQVESPNLDTKILPLKEILENPKNNYPLNYLQLLNFLDRSKGNPEIDTLASEFSPEITNISSMMRELYLHLQNRSIKTTFTKIIKRIELSSQNLNKNG